MICWKKKLANFMLCFLFEFYWSGFLVSWWISTSIALNSHFYSRPFNVDTQTVSVLVMILTGFMYMQRTEIYNINEENELLNLLKVKTHRFDIFKRQRNRSVVLQGHPESGFIFLNVSHLRIYSFGCVCVCVFCFHITHQFRFLSHFRKFPFRIYDPVSNVWISSLVWCICYFDGFM